MEHSQRIIETQTVLSLPIVLRATSRASTSMNMLADHCKTLVAQQPCFPYSGVHMPHLIYTEEWKKGLIFEPLMDHNNSEWILVQ